MASTVEPPRGGVSIRPILAVNFVGTLGFSIVLPFLVFLVTRWGGNGFLYGVMGATYSVFQLVGAPVLGRWSDRFGRRRVLLLSQLGTFVSWGIFVLAFALPDRALLAVHSGPLGRFTLTLPLIAVFVARACDGITGGNVSVANAYLADLTPESRRARNFGQMAVAANLGFILGPAIAAALAATRLGDLGPVLAALGISLAAALMVAFGLPDPPPCRLASDPEPPGGRRLFGQGAKPCFEIERPGRLGLRELAALDGVPVMLAINFLVMLGFNFYYVAFPVYAATSLGWSVGQTGVYFSVLSLLMAAVEGPVLARASRRWSDRALAIAGSAVLCLSFLPLLSHRLAWIYGSVVLLALGNGLMWPSVVSLLSLSAGRRWQGAVQGLAGSAGALASILGLLLGGALYARLESDVFVLSSLTILAVFLLALLGTPPRGRGDSAVVF